MSESHLVGSVGVGEGPERCSVDGNNNEIGAPKGWSGVELVVINQTRRIEKARGRMYVVNFGRIAAIISV